MCIRDSPGIDDGAPDENVTLAMLQEYVQLGIKKIVATPHVRADYFKNTLETIQAAAAKTNAPVSYTHLDVYKRQINGFVDGLKRNDRNNGAKLLLVVEFHLIVDGIHHRWKHKRRFGIASVFILDTCPVRNRIVNARF